MTDRRRETVDTVLARRQPDLTVLAERLHKPRNFSALIRSCDAVGINEVQNFGKFRVTGPNARAWLDRIMAGGYA